MEVKVHIEDHRDVLTGGALAIIGIACLVLAKRVVTQQMEKMKSDIVITLEKAIGKKEQ